MWQFEAVCGPEDEKLMFSELPSKIEKMKSLCATCPVEADCLNFAIANDIEWGIFGGTTPKDRRILSAYVY